jgi:hypothetical protein
MKISKEKREKISEQILALLFQNSPKLLFTFHIAKEIARDEEFTKELLLDLRNKGLVMEVKKNPEGVSYKKRARWKLSDNAYEIYKKHSNLD